MRKPNKPKSTDRPPNFVVQKAYTLVEYSNTKLDVIPLEEYLNNPDHDGEPVRTLDHRCLSYIVARFLGSPINLHPEIHYHHFLYYVIYEFVNKPEELYKKELEQFEKRFEIYQEDLDKYNKWCEQAREKQKESKRQKLLQQLEKLNG